MSRKQIIMIILGVVLLIAMVLVILLPGRSENDEETEATEASEVSRDRATEGPNLNEETAEAESEKPEITNAESSEQTAAPAETEGAVISKEISFPYTIPETDLVVDSVNSYDGLFLEDGSDTKISGIAAVIVKNTGNQCIDYAEISMKGSQTDYLFILSHLESNAAIVVQEAKKALCVSQTYDRITAEPAFSEEFEMSEDQLRIRETSDNQLEVKNLTDQAIPCVRIFYKFYLEEEQVYVGGITYVAKITNLKPGATVQVAPSHFAVGSSRIVMVKTFETDEE